MPRTSAKTSPRPNLSHIAEGLRHLAVPIDDVSPFARNARTHDDANVKAIMASLKAFGQRAPLVARKGDKVLSVGHGRVMAMQKLGWTHAAVLFIEESEEEAIAYGIADNRTGELAKWDYKQLSALLDATPPELQAMTGFEMDAVQELHEKYNPPAVVEDEAPAPADKAVGRAGDLWQMGRHRLLCGSSTDPADVDRVMDGKKAALVATDPPYLVDYTGERPNGTGKDWTPKYDEVSIGGKNAAKFFTDAFTQMLRVMADGAAIYCWHAHKQATLIAQIWAGLGILSHQQIIWVKPSSVFGRVFWHFRHEPCMMGWRQGSIPKHNGVHDKNSVWDDVRGQERSLDDMTREELIAHIKDNSSVWDLNWEGKNRIIGNEHPTQKPVEIFARPMRKHTTKGAICFEPFSGSGSQISAAEQTGRACHAIEISPIFVDVAVRRWQTLTGLDAVHAGTGKTWKQTAKARKVAVDG